MKRAVNVAAKWGRFGIRSILGRLLLKQTVVVFVFILLSSLASVTFAEASTRVCRADGNTPFLGGDIMEGTHLTIIISSDVDDDYWPCDLAIQGQYQNFGYLECVNRNIGNTLYRLHG